MALDLQLGVALAGVAAHLLVVSFDDRMGSTTPHGGAFGLLGAVLPGPAGVLLLAAVLGITRRWRGRWRLHQLPQLAPALAETSLLG